MQIERRFMLMAAATAGVGLATQARAQTLVDEKDGASVALGYVSNAAKADAKKYPKYATGQNCGSCALFVGKAGDAAGICPLFTGKQVRSEGWCSAWAKRG
jgi:hypothetical protein